MNGTNGNLKMALTLATSAARDQDADARRHTLEAAAFRLQLGIEQVAQDAIRRWQDEQDAPDDADRPPGTSGSWGES